MDDGGGIWRQNQPPFGVRANASNARSMSAGAFSMGANTSSTPSEEAAAWAACR
jgi:hypothetical protein